MAGLIENPVYSGTLVSFDSYWFLCPGLLIGGRIVDFIAYWQIKRDGTKRGIVEVIP